MAGITGISVGGQSISKSMAGPSKTARTDQTAASQAQAKEVTSKTQAPIQAGSSLIPTKTEYGYTIGNVQLSDQAKDYYETLKSKYSNMEFIAVSKDQKAQVQKNAAAYGNANKMVVLIDEEKLERMATDESFRKKYEGIIAMSQNKLSEMKNSLSGSGARIKNFGMSVDSDGKESFFATTEKSLDLQKKRIEKKAAEKKEHAVKEKKKAEKERREARIEKSRAEKKEKAEKAEEAKEAAKESEKAEKPEAAERPEPTETLLFEADSAEALLSKVSAYSYNEAASRVRTQQESTLGTVIDFRG